MAHDVDNVSNPSIPASRLRPTDLVHLPLTGPGLDRCSDERHDPVLVERLLADERTKVLALRGGRAPVSGNGSDGRRLITRSPQPDDADRLAVFLGRSDDRTAYLLVVESDDGAMEFHAPHADSALADDAWRSLREVGARLSAAEAAIVATSLALTNWHLTHHHCSRCGAATEIVQAGWVRRCPADESLHFPRTDPAVIMSVIDDTDRFLLARGPRWVEKRYSVLAGFVEPGEALVAAVAREVREEVGVDVVDIIHVGAQPWPFPSSLMLGFTARALTTELTLQESEIAEAMWVTRDELAGHLADRSWGIPPRLSISRALIERWFGEPITAVP